MTEPTADEQPATASEEATSEEWEPSAEEYGTWHRHFAGEMLAEAWDLMTRGERTPAEDRRMLSRALGALAHHEASRSPGAKGEEELAVACWLVSRVYAALGEGYQAVAWAEEALRHASVDDVDPSCRANALEAVARGLATAGGIVTAQTFIDQARAAYSDLDEETRATLERELADIECRLATDRP